MTLFANFDLQNQNLVKFLPFSTLRLKNFALKKTKNTKFDKFYFKKGQNFDKNVNFLLIFTLKPEIDENYCLKSNCQP